MSIRILALVVLVVSSAATAQGPNLRVGIAAVSQPVLLDSLARPQPLTGARAQVLAAIISVYDSLAIPIDYRNTEAGVVVAERFTVRRQLGKVPLSRYLDCGQGMNGVNANFYRITMVVAAWLFPTEGPVSEVRFAVVGSGQDMAGSNVQSVLCNSKGVLEEEIATLARKRLASTGQ
jgi:hypothetical protein